MRRQLSYLVSGLVLGGLLPSASAQGIKLQFQSSITNSLGESVVFDPFTKRAFGNSSTGVEWAGIDSNLQFGPLGSIDVATYVNGIGGFSFGGVTSVDTDPLGRGFGVASVINATSAAAPGAAVFFNTVTGSILGHQNVGLHPDMITFNSAGTNILVANESDNATTNGDLFPGSISNIDVSSVTATLSFVGVTTTTRDFSGPTGLSDAQLMGIRDHGSAMNGPTTIPDRNRLEPEYISISGNTAYVTLQEANAVAIYDISTNSWTGVHNLGVYVKAIDSLNNNTISVTTTIATLPTPDAIATFTVGGNTYYATADEGDYRDNNADRATGSSLVSGTGVGQIDPTYAATLGGTSATNPLQGTPLAGTRVFRNTGDLDGDGDIDQIRIAGSRGMSIYDAATGTRVFHTDEVAGFGGFEVWIANNDPTGFNINQSGTAIDQRSRDKGPEPEALALGEYNGDLYALVGAERTNHLFLFRLVNDVGSALSFTGSNVQLIDVIRQPGEFGPETIDFVSAANSPNGTPFFLVGSEISNTWAIYSIPEPSAVALLAGGLVAGVFTLRSRIRR